MNKQERAAYAKTLQSMSDEDLFELAQHRVVTKQNSGSDFNPADAVADIEFQLKQKSYQQQPQPQASPHDSELVTVSYLNSFADFLIDEIGTCTGQFERQLRIDMADKIKAATEPLRKQIVALKKELATVRNIADGSLTVIGSRNGKSAA